MSWDFGVPYSKQKPEGDVFAMHILWLEEGRLDLKRFVSVAASDFISVTDGWEKGEVVPEAHRIDRMNGRVGMLDWNEEQNLQPNLGRLDHLF